MPKPRPDQSNGKKCSTCQVLKPLSEFNGNRSTWDGVCPECKVCKTIRDADYYKRHSEEHKSNSMRWKRTHREKINELNRMRYNPELEKQKRKNRRQINWAKVRETERKHKERRRGANIIHTRDEWIALCDQYNNICLSCRRNIKLERDHIIPLSKGGDDHINNIQPLCRSCNAKKHDKTIDYRSMG